MSLDRELLLAALRKRGREIEAALAVERLHQAYVSLFVTAGMPMHDAVATADSSLKRLADAIEQRMRGGS
jgi:hypothetical protein